MKVKLRTPEQAERRIKRAISKFGDSSQTLSENLERVKRAKQEGRSPAKMFF